MLCAVVDGGIKSGNISEGDKSGSRASAFLKRRGCAEDCTVQVETWNRIQLTRPVMW